MPSPNRRICLSGAVVGILQRHKKKKKHFKSSTFSSIPPPPPAEAKVKFPTPRAKRVVKCPRFAWVGNGAIHSTKISRNFGPKLNGSVRSNRKSFEKTGPPFEVVLFSRSDRLEFWLNGSRPKFRVDRRTAV